LAREPDWRREIREAMRNEAWTLVGPSGLVKVVRLATMINVPAKARAPGYVTQQRYLFGKTPAQIERDFGLPPFSLDRGCRVFRLERLPQRSEYTYELSAAEPDGLAFNPADAWEARARFVNDPSLTEVPYYPPGNERIPQWRVTGDIPLIHLFDLLPNVTYPRP
jgi:hypothetical protein